MARWLSFFAEYNFEVKYKPGKQNVLADALSRRPDYELAHVTTLSSPIEEFMSVACPRDSQCVAFFQALGSEDYKDSDSQLSARLRASLHRYSINNDLLCYRTDGADTARIVVPHDADLKYRILFEAHDTALGGHWAGKALRLYESTLLVAQTLQMGGHIRAYMRNVPAGQIIPHSAAPRASLPVLTRCWEFISMDFVWSFQNL